MPPYFYQSRLSPYVQPHWSSTVKLPPRHDIKDQQNKGIKMRSPIVKCDNCQGYGHRADTCAYPFRVVIIGGVPATAPMLDSTIPPVITLVVKESSDIASKD